MTDFVFTIYTQFFKQECPEYFTSYATDPEVYEDSKDLIWKHREILTYLEQIRPAMERAIDRAVQGDMENDFKLFSDLEDEIYELDIKYLKMIMEVKGDLWT
jgi:hypothetical protein